MAQYIDKAALVAELNILIAELVEEGEGTMFEQGRISAFEDVKVFINHTLEVKEVEEEPVSEDLGEAANTYIDNWYKLNNLDKESYPIDVEISKNDFKAGAKWQKKQEVKKVDLEKEIHYAADQYDINNNGNIYWEDIVGFAKHFFELGLKAKGE